MEYAPTARHDRQGLPRRQHAGRRARRWPSDCAPPDASRCACCPTAPSAMRAAIVGLAFSTAPRDGRLRADRPPRRSATTAERCRSTTRARRAAAGARGSRRSRRSGHDLKFDAIVLARHGVDAARARHRHDARELPARRDAVGAPARGSRARAHRLQGADARRTSAAAARRRCRSPMCRSRRRSTTPASAPIWRGSSRRRCASCWRKEELDDVYQHARAAADSGAGGDRARRRPHRRRRRSPRSRSSVDAGAGTALTRADLRAGRRASSTSTRRSSSPRSCSTSCSCRC